MNLTEFEARKRDHIQQALHAQNQAIGLTGLESVHLSHEALPDLNLDELSLDTLCLGKPLSTPFFVSGMTAGHEDAPSLNLRMAKLCQQRGWAMGVGSQRRELHRDSESVDHWSKLRELAPDLVLFANLGISQLVETPVDRIREIVRSIAADAIAIHLNPLQECMQPEGTPHFRGAFDALERLVQKLGTPVVVKETGCGFSEATLKRLSRLPLAAVDVSGLGGTHWGRIEGARAAEGSLFAAASRTFENWGETTVESVRRASRVLKKTQVWASGGVRSGLDSAKLIALGAHRVGYAKPALEAALESERALNDWMELQEFELRVALFCTGCRTPQELPTKELAWH